MDSVSPVLTEHEIDYEQVVALGSSNYFPIIVTRFKFADGSPGTATRFRFSDKEREQIAQGADLVLTQPHHGPLMPICLQLAFKDSYPIPEG